MVLNIETKSCFIRIVEFKTKEMCQKAVEKLNRHEIKARKILVKLVSFCFLHEALQLLKTNINTNSVLIDNNIKIIINPKMNNFIMIDFNLRTYVKV